MLFCGYTRRRSYFPTSIKKCFYPTKKRTLKRPPIYATPYALTTAYIKLLKSGSELVIPFSTMVRAFRFNSFSNVFHDTVLHDVPATVILPESWFLSCNVNAVEMSLCISNSPSPIVQIRAIPSAVRWLRMNR